jgi:type VI secretion system protein ImpC
VIKFACPHCKNVIGAPESAAGTVAACPRCRQRFRVPGAPSAAPRGLGLPPDLPRAAVLLFLRLVRENRTASANAPAAVKEAIAALDRRLSAQLREVMHHADFRALESTWRGLHYLVSRTETSPLLQICVLNVGKQELARDIRRAGSFDLSRLFEKVVTEASCQPYGLLVGDYAFGRDEQDIGLLEAIAHVAAAAHAPFVAAAAPALLSLERYTELAAQRDLATTFQGAEYAAWNSFRESEDSRYVALTLPRVLARAPFGADSGRVEAFAFEEAGGENRSDTYVWANAAWAYAACVTRAFAEYGWLARTRGVHGGGKVEGLPAVTRPADSGGVARCPTEVALSDRREYELARLGFLPLLHLAGTESAVFMGNRSCHKPQKYPDPAANAQAELSAELTLLLCLGRFAHPLKGLAHDLGPRLGASACQCRLNDWLNEYVIADPGRSSDDEWARRPLTTGRVEVREVRGRPGRYGVTAHLALNFQLEELTALCLAMEVGV